MAIVHRHENWSIRVKGDEHPPVHAHVAHPDGRALIYLDGRILNSGVPEKVLREACTWIAVNHSTILAEWNLWNAPRK